MGYPEPPLVRPARLAGGHGELHGVAGPGRRGPRDLQVEMLVRVAPAELDSRE